MKKAIALIAAGFMLAACGAERPTVEQMETQIELDIVNDGGEELLAEIPDAFVVCLASELLASDLSDGYLAAYVESGDNNFVEGYFDDSGFEITEAEDAAGEHCLAELD